MGFTTDADPDTVQRGPQPYGALISEICTAFGCTPREAERQDYRLVLEVFDYRNAKHAIDLFNGGAKGSEQLGKHPELMDLLVDMHRAQLGITMTHADVLANVTDRDRTEEEAD